jgi:hypothetical protein
MPRPKTSEYAAFFDTYIKLVSEEEIMPVMHGQRDAFVAFLHSIPESESMILHPPYTWTIKQVLGHLIDCEVVFGYRALRFARGDTTILHSFDENLFVDNGHFNDRSLLEMAEHFAALRTSNLHQFGSLAAEAWDLTGQSGTSTMSVRSLAYCLVGHVRHHGYIMAKRTGQAWPTGA